MKKNKNNMYLLYRSSDLFGSHKDSMDEDTPLERGSGLFSSRYVSSNRGIFDNNIERRVGMTGQSLMLLCQS